MIRGFIVWASLVVVSIGLVVFYLGFGGYKESRFANVKIKDKIFEVEVADTPIRRVNGLSNRETLNEDGGMLFIFDSQKFQSFWMKDMMIPIDIIWIDGDTIAGFSEKAYPEPGVPILKLKSYYSPKPVDKVLEVYAGTVEKYGFEIGDTVSIDI